MKHVDMRKLAPAAQEERRRQVIGLRQNGARYAAIAAQLGLSQTGVFDICQRFAAQGENGLVSDAWPQARRAAAADDGAGAGDQAADRPPHAR